MPVTPKAPSGVLASVIAAPSELSRHLREQGQASAAEIAQIEREPVSDDLARMAKQVEDKNKAAEDKAIVSFCLSSDGAFLSVDRALAEADLNFINGAIELKIRFTL